MVIGLQGEHTVRCAETIARQGEDLCPVRGILCEFVLNEEREFSRWGEFGTVMSATRRGESSVRFARCQN